MGYFDAQNDYHEDARPRKTFREYPVLLILISCGLMILFAFFMRIFFDRRMAAAEKGDAEAKDYVTEDWVTRKLEIYAGDLATEDEVRQLTRSIRAIDENRITVDPETVTDEDLKSLYTYVERKVRECVSEVSEEQRPALAGDIVRELLSVLNGDGRQEGDPVKDAGSGTGDLLKRFDMITEEIAKLKENGVETTDLSTLSEEDVKKILRDGTLTQKEIDSWIRAANKDITSGYKKADEAILSRLDENDRKTTESLSKASDQLHALSGDLSAFEKKLPDLEAAKQKLASVEAAIGVIERSVEELSENSDSEHEKTILSLNEMKKDLLAAKESLLAGIASCREENKRNRTETEEMLNLAVAEADGKLRQTKEAFDLLIDEVTEDFTNKLDAVGGSVLENSQRLDTVSGSVRENTLKLNNVSGSIEEHTGQITEMEGELNDLKERVSTLEELLRTLSEKTELIEGSLKELTGAGSLSDALDALPRINLKGNAKEENVLAGFTFTNTEGTDRMGTMKDKSGDITVPSGSNTYLLESAFYSGSLDLSANNSHFRDIGREEGYRNGYETGKTDGYESGKADGYDDGYAHGNTDGYDTGYSEGRSRGRNDVTSSPSSYGLMGGNVDFIMSDSKVSVGATASFDQTCTVPYNGLITYKINSGNAGSGKSPKHIYLNGTDIYSSSSGTVSVRAGDTFRVTAKGANSSDTAAGYYFVAVALIH